MTLTQFAPIPLVLSQAIYWMAVWFSGDTPPRHAFPTSCIALAVAVALMVRNALRDSRVPERPCGDAKRAAR